MVSKKENVTEFANTIIINERNFLVRVIYKLYSFIYPHFSVYLSTLYTLLRLSTV